MSGQRCLDRTGGRFCIANFSDQNNIRVMSQNTAKSGRKRQTNLALDLNLTDLLQVLFDRILNGDDLQIRLANLTQGTVKRCRLSTSGRPGDQQQAVRSANQLLPRRTNRFGKLDGIKAEH